MDPVPAGLGENPALPADLLVAESAFRFEDFFDATVSALDPAADFGAVAARACAFGYGTAD